MSILLKGGTIVTATDRYVADVFAEDRTIDHIGRRLEVPAEQVIDATGKLLFPGGVDVHVHNDETFGGTHSSDDFYTGTIAAACGGTTTVVDFAYQSRGGALAAALAEWRSKGDGKAVIDYGLHIIVVDPSESVLNEIPAMVAEGVTSFKMFMAYKGDLMADDATLFRVMRRCAEAGALVGVHAENGDLVDVLVKEYLAGGKVSPRYHCLSRPPEVEVEATSRAIQIARLAGASLYVVHLSASEALDKVAAARRSGQRVFAETCPQYLALTSEGYEGPGFEAAKLVCSPPLRSAHHQEALWRGLSNGDLQVVASDHSTFNFAGQKDLGRENFAKIPNGLPGVETRLYLLYSLGVKTGRIGENRFVDLISTTPAKLFGLFPQKGTIAVGSDADLIVWDPSREVTISQRHLHQNVDYTPYEGFQVKGAPEMVISKGRVIVRDNIFLGERGAGQYIKRKRFSPQTLA